jgi:hypothetical protein
MAPACADVEGGDDVMRFFEEFVAGPLDDAAETENVEEGDEEHGKAAPYYVGFGDEGLVD